MTEREKEMTLQVLLDEYRMLSGELLLYLEEIIKSFVFLTVLVGFYLGIGIGAEAKQNGFLADIKQYLPYGFPILSLYFLVLSYIRIGLSTRRGIVERKINELMGSELMGFDAFAQQIQSRGFMVIGSRWYAKFPTPMLLFGILILIGGLLVFSVDNVAFKGTVFFYSVLACGLLTLYVFFAYPKLARRIHERATKNADKGTSKK